MGRATANRVLKAKLSVEGINGLIQQLQSYQDRLDFANQLFVQKLANIGLTEAHSRIVNVQGQDIDKSGCSLSAYYGGSNRLQYVIIRLTGSEALYVEFGSGVRYNSTQNPLADKFGYGVGTNSPMGHYNDPKGWWYIGDDDGKHHSYGTKATMPMFNARMEILNQIMTIAREVFQGVI